MSILLDSLCPRWFPLEKHEERSKFFRPRSPGWQAAGNEMKYLLDHEPTEEETTWVLQSFRSLKAKIAERGTLSPIGPPESGP